MRHLKYFGFVPNAFVWAAMTTPYCEFVTVTAAAAAARPLATLIEKRVILSAIYQKYHKTFTTFRARQAIVREHTTADFALRVCTRVRPKSTEIDCSENCLKFIKAKTQTIVNATMSSPSTPHRSGTALPIRVLFLCSFFSRRQREIHTTYTYHSLE